MRVKWTSHHGDFLDRVEAVFLPIFQDFLQKTELFHTHELFASRLGAEEVLHRYQHYYGGFYLSAHIPVSPSSVSILDTKIKVTWSDVTLWSERRIPHSRTELSRLAWKMGQDMLESLPPGEKSTLRIRLRESFGYPMWIWPDFSNWGETARTRELYVQIREFQLKKALYHESLFSPEPSWFRRLLYRLESLLRQWKYEMLDDPRPEWKIGYLWWMHHWFLLSYLSFLSQAYPDFLIQAPREAEKAARAIEGGRFSPGTLSRDHTFWPIVVWPTQGPVALKFFVYPPEAWASLNEETRSYYFPVELDGELFYFTVESIYHAKLSFSLSGRTRNI